MNDEERSKIAKILKQSQDAEIKKSKDAGTYTESILEINNRFIQAIADMGELMDGRRSLDIDGILDFWKYWHTLKECQALYVEVLGYTGEKMRANGEIGPRSVGLKMAKCDKCGYYKSSIPSIFCPECDGKIRMRG